MLDRIINFITQHDISNDSLHGFRLIHSTYTSGLEVTDYITKAMDKGLYSIGLFLDVSKAFDSINEIPKIKLEHYGIRGVALSWFLSYLSNRYQFLQLNSQCSLLRSNISRMPQDSILGSLPYIIYVKDIFNVNNGAKCVLYANETVILVSGPDLDVLWYDAIHIFTCFSTWLCSN